jgi:hypothetical protein
LTIHRKGYIVSERYTMKRKRERTIDEKPPRLIVQFNTWEEYEAFEVSAKSHGLNPSSYARFMCYEASKAKEARAAS